MNEVTIYIPRRLAEGVRPIKEFIEKYCDVVGVKVEIIIGGQWDAGQIYIKDGVTLPASVYTAVDNACNEISALSNEPGQDPWRASTEALEDIKDRLKEIDSLFFQSK